MASFIAVVVGLSLIFGVLTLAIVAELCYMIWWRKKKNKPLTAREIDEVNTSYVQELLYILSSTQQQQQQPASSSFQSQSSDLEIGSTSSRTLLLKTPASNSVSNNSGVEESVESELMRLHNLSGPPRFLFTIKEEAREDLDSEDRSRKGSRTRSLSDVILTSDTPFLTPIASPRIKSPTLLNHHHHHQHPSFDYYFYNHLGFNPLYEATSFEEIECRLKQSPPPKFKFLRDAEEKLHRRLKEHILTIQASLKNNNNDNNASSTIKDDQIGSLITLISGVKKDKDQAHHSSASSKVLPLPSSPSRFKLHTNN